MNTTRIEVPVALSPPRFEDESTVATARQVKPIGRAKVTFGLRKIKAALPLLLAATLCGALGAAAVNYFERQRQVQSVSVPEKQANSHANQTAVNTKPVAITPASEPNGSTDQVVADQAKESASKTDDVAKRAETNTEAKAEAAHRIEEALEEKAKTPKKTTDPDPTKLTRQRRVRPTSESVPANKSGAGRIADLFGGPNP